MGSVKKEERQSVFFCMGRLLFLLALLMVRVRWGNRFEENRPAAGGRISERKKWLVVILLHGGVLVVVGGGGGAFVSSHSLDGVVSDKLRKTAPALQGWWTLRARPAPRKAVGGCWDLLQGGGYFHPAGVPVSAQHCLVPRVSLFFGELSTWISIKIPIVLSS